MSEPTFENELVMLINAHKEKGLRNVEVLQVLDTWREHVARWTKNDADKAIQYLTARSHTEKDDG